MFFDDVKIVSSCVIILAIFASPLFCKGYLSPVWVRDRSHFERKAPASIPRCILGWVQCVRNFSHVRDLRSWAEGPFIRWLKCTAPCSSWVQCSACHYVKACLRSPHSPSSFWNIILIKHKSRFRKSLNRCQELREAASIGLSDIHVPCSFIDRSRLNALSNFMSHHSLLSLILF
mgnify:CR=1 FL=1